MMVVQFIPRGNGLNCSAYFRHPAYVGKQCALLKMFLRTKYCAYWYSYSAPKNVCPGTGQLTLVDSTVSPRVTSGLAPRTFNPSR